MGTSNPSAPPLAVAPLEGFLYLGEFLDGHEQHVLLERLRGLRPERELCRGQWTKRLYAQFEHAYVTARRRLVPASPLPDFLAALVEKGLPHCPSGSRFDQCIVTLYPPGAGIGWHTDKPCFGDCIMAVSLGNPARLQFATAESDALVHEVLAAPGSLYVLHGRARDDYRHRIVDVEAERYSVTFRSVKSEVQ